MSDAADIRAEPVSETVLEAAMAPTGLGAVEVTGEDRVDYLQNVLSQDVATMRPGQLRAALHLDQHGAPLAALDVGMLDERIVLLTPDGAVADDLAERLGSRTFLADARFSPLEVDSRSLRGDAAARTATAAGIDVEPGAITEDAGCLVAGQRGGLDLVGPADAVAGLAARLVEAGAEEVTPDALEAWRVAAGIPAWASEIRPPHLPEEAGVLPTHVHLDKGCYPGQEAVARMWMLGRPRRRLARVVLAGEAGAGWEAGTGRERVEVTSAATYAGERVGLAYVPPTAEPGQRFSADDGEVIVRDHVAADEPIPGQDPSVVRRRDRRGTD